MDCQQLVFTNHAIYQLFARKISIEAIEMLVKHGEIIRSYFEDKPFPSFLILHWFENLPIHAVVSQDNLTRICTIITAYYPDKALWTLNFKLKIVEK